MHNCRSLYLSCKCSRTSIGWADVWALAPIMAYHLRYQVHKNMEYYSFKTNWQFKVLQTVKPGRLLALKLVLTDKRVSQWF